jgi:phosphatidylcholine synthase
MNGTAFRIGAAAVHFFTALGIVCALFAMQAAIEGRYVDMFVWLGVAFIIDGVDGTFARVFDVGRQLPRISGEKLDLVIDYVTYVFVPALAMRLAGYLDGSLGLLLTAAILVSSLYHFSDNGSKSDDHCFVGFPAIWNVVALYVFAFDMKGWGGEVLVFACVILTFVPWRWVHPMRVERWRVPTLVLTALWGFAAVRVVLNGFPADRMSQVVLAAVALYGIGLSLMWRTPPERQGNGDNAG